MGTEPLVEGSVGKADFVVTVDERHQFRQCVGEQLQLGLNVLCTNGGLLVLGDVAINAQPAHGTPVDVRYDAAIAGKPADAAVAVANAVMHRSTGIAATAAGHVAERSAIL